MENDPYEKNNVASQYPEIAAKLKKQHYQWWDKMVPYMINQNNTWDKEAPMVERYNKQKASTGIPDWMPKSIQ